MHYSQINMAVILAYQPGRRIPQITINIHRKEEGDRPSTDNYVTVSLAGVHEPKMLRLLCTHSKTTVGESAFHHFKYVCTETSISLSPSSVQPSPDQTTSTTANRSVPNPMTQLSPPVSGKDTYVLSLKSYIVLSHTHM